MEFLYVIPLSHSFHFHRQTQERWYSYQRDIHRRPATRDDGVAAASHHPHRLEAVLHPFPYPEGLRRSPPQSVPHQRHLLNSLLLRRLLPPSRWRDMIHSSTPLHVVTQSEIALITSFIYLIDGSFYPKTRIGICAAVRRRIRRPHCLTEVERGRWNSGGRGKG